MSNTSPRFGYGRGLRPLWTEQDFVCELIRKTLRKGGHRQHVDNRVRGGYAVHHGGSGEFFINCTGAELRDRGEVDAYQATLEKAGWSVRPDDSVGAISDLIVDAAIGVADLPLWLAKAFARQSVYGAGRVST